MRHGCWLPAISPADIVHISRTCPPEDVPLRAVSVLFWVRDYGRVDAARGEVQRTPLGPHGMRSAQCGLLDSRRVGVNECVS